MTSALQSHEEAFAQNNQFLLAGLGWIAFERKLNRILRDGLRSSPSSEPLERNEPLLFALLGVIAVRDALNRSTHALSRSEASEPAPQATNDIPAPTLRELLR